MGKEFSLKHFVALSILFIAGCLMYLIDYQPYWLAVPFVIVFILWVTHDPSLLFFFLMAAIPWSIEFNFTSSLGTDLPDEPLMLLTSLSILCFIIYHHKKRPLENFFLSPLTIILVLQTCWIAVAAYFSTDQLLSIKYLLAKGWYLFAFIVTPFILFQNKKYLLLSVQILTTSMMIFVVRAIIKHSTFGFTFSQINDSLWPYFRNHVSYSALLVFIIPILAAAHYLGKSRKQKKFFAILITIATVALILSYARGAWLALIVGAGAFWCIRRGVLSKAYILSFAIIITVFTWLIQDQRYMKFAHNYNKTIFHSNFEEHLQATYQLKDVSTAERFYRWIAGFRMIPEKMATGFGPNTFYLHYKSYTNTAFRTWVSRNTEHSTVHNYFLLTIIEQGVVGLLLLLVLLGYAFYTAQKIFKHSTDIFWRVAAAVCAVILAMECTVNFLSDLVETDKVGSIFYLVIATLMVADVQYRKNLKLTADVKSVS